jgi:hypothetical protein
MVRLFVTAAATAGTYLAGNFYLSPHLPQLHSFAFGFAGMGFTYLAIGSAVAGVVAFRATR